MTDQIADTVRDHAERIKQIGRDAAREYVKGKGPWKDSEINLPDDDYAVQCFIRCAQRAAQSQEAE